MKESKNKIKLIGIMFIAACLSGCTTLPGWKVRKNDDSVTQIPRPITEVKITDAGHSFSIEDNCFKITGTSKKLKTITYQKNNADIRDLAAFAICSYREQIAPKLRNDGNFSPSDFELLNFVVKVQIAALNTFSAVEIANMKKEKYLGHGILQNRDFAKNKFQMQKTFAEQLEIVKHTASINFTINKNIFYEYLIKWSDNFQILGRDVISKEINHIKKGKKEHIDGFQWRRLCLYDPTQITYICSKIFGFDNDLFEEQSLRPYKNYSKSDDETSIQWRQLNTTFSLYIKDIQTIYDDVKRYVERTKHGNEKRKLENFLLRYERELRNTVRQYAYVNIDLPFAVFCKKAYIGIQNCKGVYNDDETQIENVIHSLSQRASGAEMLKKLRSPYTAAIYIQLLELAKGELGDRWDAVKTTCKLYELDEINDIFSGENKLK